jgi:uncharacterized membrane protein YagU involved in acid resistance
MMDVTKSRSLAAIFWAGFLCGVLDITAAFITWAPQGVRPARILQGIARGLLGPKSFSGGWATAALGLALHFFIAFSAATVFYLASRKLPFLTLRPFLSGVLYGVAVYLVMYWVVMPLAHIVSSSRSSWSASAIAIVTHIACVGLPISLVVRHYSVRATAEVLQVS